MTSPSSGRVKNKKSSTKRRRASIPHPSGTLPRNLQGNSYINNEQLPQKNYKPMNLGPKGTMGAPKDPLKCWEWGYPHLQRNYPCLNQSNKFFHNLQEASTVGEVGKSHHHINAALENRQADYKYAIREIESIISNQSLSILIDPRDTLIYITSKVVEEC